MARPMTSIPLIDVIGVTGAALTTLCWLPQALKVIRERETRALSLLATAGSPPASGCGWSTALPSATGR